MADNKFRGTQFRHTEFRKTDYSNPYKSLNETVNPVKKAVKDFSVYDMADGLYEWCCDTKDTIGEKIIDGYNGPLCDKYDYMIAALSGCTTAMIDMFFVGSPEKSVLGKFTDDFADKIVVKFSQKVYEADKLKGEKVPREIPQSIAKAIDFLEARYKVNYEATSNKQLEYGEIIDGLSTRTHHFRSLAHSPDIVGLFFSVIDQFTGETTIVDTGVIVRLKYEKNNKKLCGENFVSKVIAGVINWLGHIMSDVAGSSGTRAKESKRGTGIPIPGFELLQFSNIDISDEIGSIADLAQKMFVKGYDARFGAAMAIPVFLNELFVTLAWAFRERYSNNRGWKDILMSMHKDRRLVRMKLVSSGCFSLIDVSDAAVRGFLESNFLTFALHINYIGLCKFALSGYREARLAIGDVSKAQLDEFIKQEKIRFDI